jgi:hypothetical protein
MARYYWDARAAAAIYAELQRRAERNTAPARPPQYWAVSEDVAQYAPGVYIASTDNRRAADMPLRRAFYKE